MQCYSLMMDLSLLAAQFVLVVSSFVVIITSMDLKNCRHGGDIQIFSTEEIQSFHYERKFYSTKEETSVDKKIIAEECS